MESNLLQFWRIIIRYHISFQTSKISRKLLSFWSSKFLH